MEKKGGKGTNLFLRMLEEVGDPSVRQDVKFMFSVPVNLLSLVRRLSLSFQHSVFLPKAAAEISW